MVEPTGKVTDGSSTGKMVDPNPATGNLGTTGVADDSSSGNKGTTGVPDDPARVRVDPAGTVVPVGLPVDPAGNMTTADMENYLEGKEVQIATVVEDMLCLLDTCLIVEPTFGLMRRSVESLNCVYLACREVWRLIEKWEEGKKEENGDFKQLIFPYKHKIGASFRVMCNKVYEKVKILHSNAQGNVDQELFYLMMQSNSKLYFAEFSDDLPGEAENAKRMASEAKTEAQARVDGNPDGSYAIKMLFLFNDAFIKYELKHSIREALSTAVKGCKMLIPCGSSTKREDYEDMIENFKKAITSWTPSMTERVGHNIEQLHPLFTNPTEMIRSVEPAAGQTTGMTAEPAARDVIAEPAAQGAKGVIGDTESQLRKHSTSREIWVKVVLYAILHALVPVIFYVFFHTKVFAEYSHYLPDLNLGVVGFILGVAFSFHIVITAYFALSGRLSQFSAIAKFRNVVISSVMVNGSVGIGCVFQRQELKEFYLMLVSLLISIYAILLSCLVSPGIDLGVPDGFASFALHICCYLRPSWWFTGLCCYCICVQVFKYTMMG